jgi:hypothetical protein
MILPWTLMAHTQNLLSESAGPHTVAGTVISAVVNSAAATSDSVSGKQQAAAATAAVAALWTLLDTDILDSLIGLWHFPQEEKEGFASNHEFKSFASMGCSLVSVMARMGNVLHGAYMRSAGGNGSLGGSVDRPEASSQCPALEQAFRTAALGRLQLAHGRLLQSGGLDDRRNSTSSDGSGNGPGTARLPSLLDVPTREQAAVTAAARQALAALRGMAAALLVPAESCSEEQHSRGSEASRRSRSWASWEVLRAELMAGLPDEDWREPLWCCNPGCTNLSGASELQLKTYACGGNCGWRYCSKECQADGWRQGHNYSCRVIAASRIGK